MKLDKGRTHSSLRQDHEIISLLRMNKIVYKINKKIVDFYLKSAYFEINEREMKRKPYNHKENKMNLTNNTITVDTATFTEEQREEFIEGWDAAGGYMDDMDGGCPWCMPWYHGNSKIDVPAGLTVADMGAEWWSQCENEIEELLEEEREFYQEQAEEEFAD